MKSVTSIVSRCFLFSCFLIINSCNTPPPKEKVVAEEQPEIAVPVFDADSAYTFVKNQVDFGPRVSNTPAHSKCARFLEAKLRAYGAKVFVQEGEVKAYNGTILKIKNIIGSYNPSGTNRILLLSHWDSRPYADHDPDPANHNTPIAGANDGASGVGVLLEIARQLSLSGPTVGIDILFADAEDYGPPQDQMTDENTEKWWGLGAQFWAMAAQSAGYSAKYGILLDMVGAPNATFLMEAVSMSFASSVVKHVWTTGNNIGYSDYFIFEPGGMITDDHLFINRITNIPTIDIIHLDRTSPTGFNPYWHTVKDDMNNIDRNTLKAVGQTLLTVIYRER